MQHMNFLQHGKLFSFFFSSWASCNINVDAVLIGVWPCGHNEGELFVLLGFVVLDHLIEKQGVCDRLCYFVLSSWSSEFLLYARRCKVSVVNRIHACCPWICSFKCAIEKRLVCGSMVGHLPQCFLVAKSE